jgi:hypothetical protein
MASMTTLEKKLLAAGCAASIAVVGLARLAGASAPAGRYALDVDTVVDTVTGLTWQRAAPSGTYTWDAAKTYCSGLSLGGIAAGGWRVPRKLELESIVDDRGYAPAIDTTAFPDTQLDYFWSSSPFVYQPNSAWFVDFRNGVSWENPTSATLWVRCVH